MSITFCDRIKKTIKLYISYPGYADVFKKLTTKTANRAIVIGSPIHTNLGDHLIAEESLRYVDSSDHDYVVEIPEFVYELFPNRIQLLPSDTIYILGGGWMGNLYEDEMVVEDILSRWSDNRIVILPQTIYFSEDGKYSSIEQLKELFKKANKLIVCVRDRMSYELCLSKLGLTQENCLLLPDMALLRLDRMKEKHSITGETIIYSLRSDAEKVSGTEILNTFRPLLKEKGYSIVDSSTALPKKTIRFRAREIILSNMINEYAKADLVITDRLHSMIFALIAGTKCIAIDNTTHKVVGIKKEWLDEYPGIRVYNSANDVAFAEVFDLVTSTEYPVKKDFAEKFNRLKVLVQSKS